MSDFSSVCGAIFLQGNWTSRAFNLLVPILGCWNIHGKMEYDIVNYGSFALQNSKANFRGYGCASFSEVLSDLNDLAWDYIAEHKSIPSAIRYRTLIDMMKEQNLSILMEFCSKGPDSDVLTHETGEILSDGEKLFYRQISCEEATVTAGEYRQKGNSPAALQAALANW